MFNHFKPLSILFFAALLLLTAFSQSAQAGVNGMTKFVASFEGGKLFMAGPTPVVELHGNFRQMGRQYGHLMSHKLKKLYSEGFERYLAGKKGTSYKEMLEGCEAMYKNNPQYIREFFTGMAETSGLTLDQHKIINGIVFGYIMSAGCSGLGVWGDYSEGGKLIFGRNWDLPAKDLISLAHYFNVVVFNPEGTSNSVADFSYAGTVFFQTSMSAKGIFLELQNAQMCDSKTYQRYTNNQLFSLLLDYSSMDEIRNGLESIRPSTGLIINAAGENAAYSYEMASYDTKCRQDDKTGFVANSNHFLDPSWQNMPAFEAGEKFACTVDRRCNLLKYAQEHKGKFTPESMMKLFDTAIPNGGPTFPDNGAIRTIYQVVVTPGDLKVRLKLRGFSQWQEIDLAPHFGISNN